jgi:hypothetical protein
LNRNEFFQQAFQRSEGLLNREEMQLLQNKTVGIVGLGGVGGAYVLGLARMGIGRLLIADFDHFEIANMNRQAGAFVSTLGQPKAETLRRMALDINPYMEVKTYSKGVDRHNVDEFVNQCDVIVDAIDFYCIDAHRLLHVTARRHKRYSLFAIPLGYSCTLQVFSPEKMSFEDYYDFQHCADFFEQVSAFAIGSAPAGTHWPYMNITGDQLAGGTPPSLSSSVNLCAGHITASVLLILTRQWEEKHSAPCYFQWDARTMKKAQGTLLWGNRGPLQKFKRWILARRFGPWRAQINQRSEEKQKNFAEYTQAAI